MEMRFEQHTCWNYFVPVTNKTTLMALKGKKYNISDVVLFESYFCFDYIQNCG